MSFLKSIVKTAGKGAKLVVKAPVAVVKTTVKAPKFAVKTAANASKGVRKVVGKVPVVGKPLSGVLKLTVGGQFELANRVLSGQRIDRAVMSEIKANVAAVKDVAPYAQMVLSMVPGVGTGISAGLGAGLSLASGQPITEAIRAGIEGSLPGGPAARSAFNASFAVVQGKPLNKIALAALPIPDGQKKALEVCLTASASLASKGTVPNKAALTAAEAQLPKDLRPAIMAGLALGNAKRLQDAAAKNVKPKSLDELRAIGRKFLEASPTLKAGWNSISDPHMKAGFEVGVAVANHTVTPLEVVAVRGKLTGPQTKGFDLALTAHIGAQAAPAVKAAVAKAPPAQVFAAQATVGAQTLTAPNQTAIVKTLATNPATKGGVTLALAAPAALPKKGFWRQLAELLGLVK